MTTVAHEERVAKLRKRVGLPTSEPVLKTSAKKHAPRVSGPVNKGSYEHQKLLKRAAQGFGTTVSQTPPGTPSAGTHPDALTERLLGIVEKYAENSGVTINENGPDLGALL